jgi:uncharacterized protein YecE (DUF72 family)
MESGSDQLPPKQAVFRVGTSGWSYEDWKGRFYPQSLPISHWFEGFAPANALALCELL